MIRRRLLASCLGGDVDSAYLAAWLEVLALGKDALVVVYIVLPAVLGLVLVRKAGIEAWWHGLEGVVGGQWRGRNGSGGLVGGQCSDWMGRGNIPAAQRSVLACLVKSNGPQARAGLTARAQTHQSRT